MTEKTLHFHRHHTHLYYIENFNFFQPHSFITYMHTHTFINLYIFKLALKKYFNFFYRNSSYVVVFL